MLPTSPQEAAPHPQPDPRLEQLEHWLAGLFGSRDFQINTASADASFRRYFRVSRHGHTWIAMDAPPEKEAIEPYIRISGMLVQMGVNAPKVMERDVAAGFLLNSDLGVRTYLSQLEQGANADKLYGDAIGALVRIQANGDVHARQLPAYGDSVLQREMALFTDWFCARHLSLEFQPGEAQALRAGCDTLAVEALRQPRVFVHRDFHSRNLMLCDEPRYGENPGILDFQDALFGPVTYDLVSLLRDCYVAWPLEQVHGWVAQFREQASAAGVATGTDFSQFLRWFDFMGVQRHMKAIGIFARLWHRDGKPGYLKEIPRTLEYVRFVTGRYAELDELHQLIESLILPALERVCVAMTPSR